MSRASFRSVSSGQADGIGSRREVGVAPGSLHGARLPSVLVLDGEWRAALGVVRTLGAQGVPVMVGGPGRLAMAGFSRYPARRFAYSLTGGPEVHLARTPEKARTLRALASVPRLAGPRARLKKIPRPAAGMP
jgi:hypothetical protein